jgi:hypothetical protein
MLLLLAGFGRAGDKGVFGDVEITLLAESTLTGSHGYTEYPYLIKNLSTERGHKVTLTLPAHGFGDRMDSLRSISRTVEVGPGATATVSLLQPFYPPVAGNNLHVQVDGRNYDTPLRVSILRSRWGAYAGGFMPSPTPSAAFGAAGGAELLVLLSPNIGGDFADIASGDRTRRLTATVGGAAGGPGGPAVIIPPVLRKGAAAGGAAPPAPAPPKPAVILDPDKDYTPTGRQQMYRIDLPLNLWNTNWLAYSRYDGVVVTGEELAAAPPGVQAALAQYVETGGALLILGKPPVLPSTWSRRRSVRENVTEHEAGFGYCLVCADTNFNSWPVPRWHYLANKWRETANPWQNLLTAIDANHQFPVVADVGIPVRGLLVLMLVFTIAIGPINLWLLGRQDRRMWMLWTVPAISLVTCLLVFGYMLIAEGWEGHLRSEGVTLLDETTHRATTFGWTAFYAPLTPGDGLHFSPETELMWQKFEGLYSYGGRGSSTSCTMDWTADQHLASGWISARVPTHFKLRKSESRRERLGLMRGKEGSLLALNALGANVEKLWLADEKGQVYLAEGIPAGSQVALTVQKDMGKVEKAATPVRTLLGSTLWLSTDAVVSSAPSPAVAPFVVSKAPVAIKTGPGEFVVSKAPVAIKTGLGGPGVPVTPAPPAGSANPAKAPLRFLAPLCYVAVLDGAPFIEDGLRNATDHKCHSIVIGLLREPDDAN